MPLPVAFALAAVLSPTDAVAVSAIVDKETVPKNLMHILEGESPLNDASGLVIFRFAAAAALTGSFSLWQASITFFFAVAGGIAAGLLAVVVISWALKLLAKLDRIAPEAQVLLIMFAPFVAFLVAEAVNASGVLAAVVAGLIAGRTRTASQFSVSVYMLDHVFWVVLAFLLNGAILVLLGLQLPATMRGLAVGHGAVHAIEMRRARITAAEAAIARLEGVAHRGGTDGAATVDQAVAEGLIATYRRRLALLEDGQTPREEAVALQRAESALLQAAMAVEREALRGLLKRGEIDDVAFNALAHELVLHDVLAETKAGSR